MGSSATDFANVRTYVGLGAGLLSGLGAILGIVGLLGLV